MTSLALSPRLDRKLIRQVYERHHRVHIGNVLTEPAALALFRCLQKEVEWRLNFNLGNRTANFSDADLNALAEVDRTQLNQHFLAAAQSGFQYVYSNSPIYDLCHRSARQPELMVAAKEFLNSSMFLQFARDVTGLNDITGADAQASRYGPGHFLTRHDDSNHLGGRRRLAAFVLNLTPNWMPDWGGFLLFYDQDGHVEEGYAPAFNALNVFRVPMPHSVSYVTPFTASYRYAISGWFHA
jgi:SM-20-related protein